MKDSVAWPGRRGSVGERREEENNSPVVSMRRYRTTVEVILQYDYPVGVRDFTETWTLSSNSTFQCVYSLLSLDQVKHKVNVYGHDQHGVKRYVGWSDSLRLNDPLHSGVVCVGGVLKLRVTSPDSPWYPDRHLSYAHWANEHSLPWPLWTDHERCPLNGKALGSMSHLSYSPEHSLPEDNNDVTQLCVVACPKAKQGYFAVNAQRWQWHCEREGYCPVCFCDPAQSHSCVSLRS